MAGVPYPDPTLREIAQRAAEVRKKWSRGEELRRRTMGPHNAYRPVGDMERVLRVDEQGRAIQPVYIQEVYCG